jgi:hypothetical protein
MQLQQVKGRFSELLEDMSYLLDKVVVSELVRPTPNCPLVRPPSLLPWGQRCLDLVA